MKFPAFFKIESEFECHTQNSIIIVAFALCNKMFSIQGMKKLTEFEYITYISRSLEENSLLF